MPDHKIGTNHSFANLITAYNADSQRDGDAHFLLYRGDEILALCLRYKFNPDPGEVWVGTDTVVAGWGARLAALKDKKTVPVYYSPRSRTFYEFRGEYLITGDSVESAELKARKGPVPLSRVVFLKKV